MALYWSNIRLKRSCLQMSSKDWVWCHNLSWTKLFVAGIRTIAHSRCLHQPNWDRSLTKRQSSQLQRSRFQCLFSITLHLMKLHGWRNSMKSQETATIQHQKQFHTFLWRTWTKLWIRVNFHFTLPMHLVRNRTNENKRICEVEIN